MDGPAPLGKLAMLNFAGARGTNLIWEPYLNDMTCHAPPDQPQSAVPKKLPHGVAYRPFRDLNRARQSADGETELSLWRRRW
jgi:hypothetical protein